MPFLKRGYRVWVVWEDEMKIRKVVLNSDIDTEIKLSNALYLLLTNKHKNSKYEKELVTELINISNNK